MFAPTNAFDFDLIIAGAGCAGLSLLMQLQDQGYTKTKKILVLDRAPKQGNDRTWCFWEEGQGIFEELVVQSWEEVMFYGPETRPWEGNLKLKPYRYKMIRSEGFYRHCMERLRKDPAVTVLYAPITEINNLPEGGASVMAGGNTYRAQYVCSSILPEEPVLGAEEHYLLQHFKGWVVETPHPVFDPSKATLMDFRVSQKEGTTFVYVLPLSPHKALVEYTLFTENLLEQEQYEEALRQYMKQFLGMPAGAYRIAEEEYGVIPMTNHRFRAVDGAIVYIGTAGGQTKASSGYTFHFIQKHSQKLAAVLCAGGDPKEADQFSARHHFYDSVLLRILRYRICEGGEIFTKLFQRGSAPVVFRFLNNESHFVQDLDVMRRLPILPFSKAALQQTVFR